MIARTKPVAHRRGPALLIFLSISLLVVSVIYIGAGQLEINPDQTVAILFNEVGLDLNVEFTDTEQSVVTDLRLPRLLLALLIGSSLATAGAAIQGLFRNPLADPALIGISSGGAFGAAMMIVFGTSLLAWLGDTLSLDARTIDTVEHWALPFAAFLGGVMATLLIYRVGTYGGVTSVATMLLAGIAINALATAAVGLLISVADDNQLRDITFWNLGSLSLASWDDVLTLAPFVIFTIGGLLWMARPLNALLLGEVEAEHLGYNVEFVKRFIILLVALAVGAGVAFAGIIGFVGLIVPHIIRLITGPDHRYVLPGSLLLGAVVLISADLFARTAIPFQEILIGIVTALVGAPIFLWLLLRNRMRGESL